MVARVLAVVVAAYTMVRGWVREQVRRMVQRPEAIRTVVMRELLLAEEGVPWIDDDTLALVGDTGATTAARARATRAPRTAAAARTLVRQLWRFVRDNPRLLAATVPDGGVTGEHFDVAVEAWMLARCEGADNGAWVCEEGRREPMGAAGARAGGTVRALLDRLGYGRGTAWTRSRGMATATGARDKEEVQHAVPIFTWEVADGLQANRPVTLWEAAAAALVVVGVVAARRVSGARGLLVEQVEQVGKNAVRVSPRHRPKQRRERLRRRRSRTARPAVVEHWMLGEFVVPWINWHKRHRTPGTAYFFPSITQGRRGKRTAVGFEAGSGFHVEPLRQWSARATEAALERCLRARGGRTFQGLRSGNNIELRRMPGVRDTTRRTLHERSLKPLIGSEEAYVEVFAEDLREATRGLGGLRIERDPDGLLSVTAVSPSAGQDPSDWRVTDPERVPWTAADADEISDGAVSGDDGDGSDCSVVGDGDERTRVVTCGRCGRRLGARDYGFLCDVNGCTWAACTDCHPGGAASPLLCPPHEAARKMKRG